MRTDANSEVRIAIRGALACSGSQKLSAPADAEL
jgi:hypothetical protein